MASRPASTVAAGQQWSDMDGGRLAERIIDRQVGMEVGIIFIFDVLDRAQVPKEGDRSADNAR